MGACDGYPHMKIASLDGLAITVMYASSLGL